MGAKGSALSAAVVLFGGLSVVLFTFRHLHQLGATTRQAIRAFATVTLASSSAYLLFVLGYARLVGAI